MCFGQAPDARPKTVYPKTDLARFVVDRLDVRSFPTSIGPRRDDHRVTFRDYGVVAHRVTEKEADLEQADGSWDFVIRILKRTDTGIFVCFADRGVYPAHYYTQILVLLNRPDSSGFLVGEKSGVAFQDCPVFER